MYKVRSRVAVNLAGETVDIDWASFSVSALCSEILLCASFPTYCVGVDYGSIVHDYIQVKSHLVLHNPNQILHTSVRDV